MKLWDRITGRKAADASDGLMDILARILNQSKKSKSGAIVSTDTALQVGAVFACVRVIAQSVA